MPYIFNLVLPLWTIYMYSVPRESELRRLIKTQESQLKKSNNAQFITLADAIIRSRLFQLYSEYVEIAIDFV